MRGRPVIGIVGAGKVGSTLARLLYQRGYAIRAVYSRTQEHSEGLAAQVAALTAATPGMVVDESDLILLAVPDDAIRPLAELLHTCNWAGKGVAHTSGAHGADGLASLGARGAMTGSLHPAFPFADVEAAVAGLPGATFAVEAADDRLRGWLDDIVRALDGRVLVIPTGGKATYHLALAIASNFTVTLYAVAEQMLLSLGTERAAANQALNALVAGTVENIRSHGIPSAMVGPLTREDVGTIRAHLAVLRGSDSTLRSVYRGLSRLSYPMLEARGISTRLIEQLIEQDEHNESDNS